MSIEVSAVDAFDLLTDPDRIDADAVHRFLSNDSYWARGIPRAVVVRSIQNSLPFALQDQTGALVAFARVITDQATFAYLADVFVLPAWRGVGVGKRLMSLIMADSRLQNLRIFMLSTRDAHGLYAHYGFGAHPVPERIMIRSDPDVYARLAAG